MEMESQTEVLGMGCHVSSTQATLLKDIDTPEEGRRDFNGRIESNRSHQRIFDLKAAGEFILALSNSLLI